ncbi:MAG: winged helix-turn-helix transcriptional regulator, partial [Paludibacteraceae bacterium]|nr:winged helix-turn-helix transcriptional regulator [Paludibacteraceae bacterium]
LEKADKDSSAENATNEKNETSFETSLKQVLKQSDYDKLYVVIQKLASEKNITIQEVMTLTGKSRTTAWRYMKKLTDTKLVEASGNTNDAVYTVAGDKN